MASLRSILQSGMISVSGGNQEYPPLEMLMRCLLVLHQKVSHSQTYTNTSYTSAKTHCYNTANLPSKTSIPLISLINRNPRISRRYCASLAFLASTIVLPFYHDEGDVGNLSNSCTQICASPT